ncbi:MAG: inositol monophosphatase family protein, partial [Pseudomonadota bacterium]
MTGLPGAFDVGAVSTIMAEICASEMVPRFRNLSDSEIELKGVNDPVTVVDKKCEQLLSERLSQLFPEAGFVGEETYAADPSILSRLSEERPVWIVDPLDGTANFASGTAEFGMIVALASGGRTVAGWIHHPLTNATYHAVRGEGAFGPNGQLELPAPAS